METIIVNSKNLFNEKENPTFCLSPLRALERCHQCPVFARFKKGYKKELSCKPRINKRFLLDLFQIEKTEEEIRRKKKELDEIRVRVGIKESP